MSKYTVISKKICKKTNCFCYPNEEDGILYVITNDGEIVVKIDENRIYMFKMVNDYINIPICWRLEESHYKTKKAIVFEKTITINDDLSEIIICELRKIINTYKERDKI